ncbi:DUF721 domain-containing protein [Bifidobacterium sp.]|jgi:predicted nucleic acid-binding Zn ribbon protein|uniref:DUF721 domain-containing protein n=1 Tax=Bifidobacterium sp. TaxID=41200 RepID=UPI0025C2E2BB|nr:DUF721 domain-containing protein [Bifidobacterium sp.]MCH4209519.1 DciA family protein [Bifidobacterium sp.]MCI1224803.1 DciA family protein [Bifidobacterium sp.]
MTPPIATTLHLDQRKLPAEIFNRFAARAGVYRDRRQREEEAWDNFGKPGRDPDKLGGVLRVLADRGGWLPNLKIAQLRNHWDQVVGQGIAQHSQVVGFDEGILTIRTESTVWATQLTYLMPQLSATIRKRLQGLDIREIRVTGPHAGPFGRGRMRAGRN